MSATESVLNEETWLEEANAAINDIKKHVKSASVAKLQITNQQVYINLTTLENKRYCVEMSSEGFRIVGREHDDMSLSGQNSTVYETPYSLLNDISPKYKQSFGGELMSKLMDLAKKEG